MSHLVNICPLVLHFFLILSLCPQRDELRSNERKGGAVKTKKKNEVSFRPNYTSTIILLVYTSLYYFLTIYIADI